MFAPQQLISPSYRDLQKILHDAKETYGCRGDKWAGIVLQVAIQYGATSILDYGAGTGSLAKALRQMELGAIRVDEYDPAIPGKDGMPSFADLVNVTDVLEHIEPDRLDAVLAHLKLLARKVLFVVIATKPTSKVLADGRNAHLIIQPSRWWRNKLVAAGFTLHPPPTVVRIKPGKEYAVVLTP